MSDERPLPSPAERHIARSRIDDEPGRALSRSSLERRRTIEAYLRSGFLPRFMERLREIHRETERHRAELEGAYAALHAELGDDPEAFAHAWTARVERWRFDEVNELVRQHNAWYPIERDLPMDPRTGDYVLVAGRSYRREELTPAWALARFPARPQDRSREAGSGRQ